MLPLGFLSPLASIIILPTVRDVVALRLVAWSVPATSKSYYGVVVFTPTRLLLTSRYRRSVSNAKSTPFLTRLDFKSGPDMRPTAIFSPQYGDPVPLATLHCGLTTV